MVKGGFEKLFVCARVREGRILTNLRDSMTLCLKGKNSKDEMLEFTSLA